MENKVTIEYNPFSKEISLKASNGQWGSEDGLHGNYFEEYSDKIPHLIITEICNSSSADIDFIGRATELEELENVFKMYCSPNTDISYKITHTSKYEYNLKVFLNDFKSLPNDCMDKDKKNIILNEVSSNILMNVIGLYSSGKSTFINALLKDELLHTEADIATNKIFRIVNTDDNSKVINITNVKSKKITKKDYTNKNVNLRDKLKEYNSQEDISEIELNINIPSINSTHFGFEILDTPGVNNANNISHQKLAYDNIRDNETNPIIAFIINANSYISTDQDELFSAINDTLKDKDIVNTERFFFIVNRADEIKAKEFEKLSKNIEKYLKDKFSSDVKIFYTNSYYATLINKKLNNIELDDEEKYELKQYIGKTKILKFLPEYSSISKYTKQSIEEFKYIKDEDSKEDKLKKALYYTGIPVVELAIQKYIDNYAVIHKFQYAFENIEKYISDYKYKLKDKIKKKDKLLGELSDLSDNTSSNEVKLETIKNSIDLIKKQIVQSDNDIKAIDKYINKLEPEINKFKEKIKNLTLNTKELDDINRKWADTISKQNKKSDNIKNLNSIAHELSHRGVSSKTAAQHGVRNQFRKEAATIVNDFKNILDSHKHGLGNLKEEFDNDINVKGLDEKKLVFNASKDDLKKKRDNDKIDYFSLGISKLFRDKEIINKDEILKLDIELRKELEAIKKESNKELNDLKTNTKKEIDKLIVHIKNKKTEKMNDSKKLEKKKEELGNCINNQENISSNNERLKKVIKGIYDELSSIDTVINNIDNYIVRLDSLVKLKDYHEKN